MKTNIIVTLFIILSAGCMVLTLATDGYLYLQGRHKVEIAAIEADHADELVQLWRRVEKVEKQKKLYIGDIAGLRQIAVFFRDKAIEEYYLGKFNMCLELKKNIPLCDQIVVKNWHQQEHKRPPPPTWDWEKPRQPAQGDWQ